MDQQETKQVQHDEEEHCTVQNIGYTVEPALPENITNEIDRLLHLAAHVMADGHEIPYALYIVMSKDGDVHMLDTNGAPTQQHAHMFVGQYAHQHDGVAILSLAEAWMLKKNSPDEKLPELPEGMSIKDMPGAFEGLRLSIETLNGSWLGSAKLSPHIETEEGFDDKHKAPRTIEGPMEIVKLKEDEFMPQLLLANRMKELPEPIRQVMQKLVDMAKQEGVDTEIEVVKPTVH